MVLQKRHNHKKATLMVFLFLLLVYFQFHLFFGERSLPNLLILQEREVELITELDRLEDQHAAILDKVTRLRPASFDPDLAEEYALKMLGHGFETKDRIVQVRYMTE